MGYKMKRFREESPVLKVDLPDGINAKAEKDGTILVDKKLKGKKLHTAVKHEKVHMDQMKRGDLDYDDSNVYWKGKTYSRNEMMEGDKNLPWEKEAYKKQNK
jgi:hypothetical protein